jgi:uncharacterized protein (TIGR02598 family)
MPMKPPRIDQRQTAGSAVEACPAPLRRRERGFSLVEVVIALGIISFAVVALLGLLTVSANSSRFSDEDTVIASIARQVTAELRSTPFATLPTGGATWYFDHEARRLGAATGAIYRCQITLTADADYNSSSGAPNLYQVRLVFSSALGSNPAVLQTASTALFRND